ncbi:uncharacterized protein L3040_000967 [Drepanopeziza brunnea f. sp. 'multigermtubi']|uniref:Uncharacterized protein n=1 Tax=Marssonina brunnea f. sp. multigermtubi (strain MB_m1) TaxID=1072389 RepID=K1WT86_MARBU|nr:uncharacterized protein MBM_01547 [Drepanopeziza brunnea f. sp. 'multigermtubi' MB_m1]EKD20865.1 hypothetical protein MBM_01547 [Drepanopeziza brunnea f. sp. 'multigermtubi' MB_m1]KAJ5054701.1 hypothetical protein L3040_000967 [Drepanopeziza brunnea f. sp. 'multigermtubi']
MARNRRGYHRPQNEEPTWQEDQPWQDRTRSNQQANQSLRFQAPTRPRTEKFNNKNPFQKCKYSRPSAWDANSHQDPAHLQVHGRFDHNFVTKSKKLKEYLVRSLSQALSQIEQWYPDPGDDEMDWQHEEEIVVTKPLEVCYVWGTGGGFPNGVGEAIPRWSPPTTVANGVGFGGNRAMCAQMRESLPRENASQPKNSGASVSSSLSVESGIA